MFCSFSLWRYAHTTRYIDDLSMHLHLHLLLRAFVQETYGEDPFLSGRLAQHFVRGLQGDHPRYLLTVATCKHFLAYNGPENQPITRHKFDAIVRSAPLPFRFFPLRSSSLCLHRTEQELR